MICGGGKEGHERSAGELGRGGAVGRDTAVQWLHNIWETSQSKFSEGSITALLGCV